MKSSKYMDSPHMNTMELGLPTFVKPIDVLFMDEIIGTLLTTWWKCKSEHDYDIDAWLPGFNRKCRIEDPNQVMDTFNFKVYPKVLKQRKSFRKLPRLETSSFRFSKLARTDDRWTQFGIRFDKMFYLALSVPGYYPCLSFTYRDVSIQLHYKSTGDSVDLPGNKIFFQDYVVAGNKATNYLPSWFSFDKSWRTTKRYRAVQRLVAGVKSKYYESE